MIDTDDYFSKKYGLTRTHSEVLEAVHQYGLAPVGAATRVLDAGCGNGRNTLFLAARGCVVDAWDIAAAKLDRLNDIALQEALTQRIYTRCVDFNHAVLSTPGQATDPLWYDLAVSTVVLMFLQPQAALRVMDFMQAATRVGGHNLIVAAMDSDDYPCPAGLFPFTFAPGQLRRHYAGWELRKYNEDLGQLHRKDAQGNFITLRFATMLARKQG